MDQRCLQNNHPAHTIEAKVQAEIEPQRSHSSCSKNFETSNKKRRKELGTTWEKLDSWEDLLGGFDQNSYRRRGNAQSTATWEAQEKPAAFFKKS